MELLESIVGTMGRVLIAVVLLSLLFMCCVFESFLVGMFCCNHMDGIRDEAAAKRVDRAGVAAAVSAMVFNEDEPLLLPRPLDDILKLNMKR